jgi:hypothetical protein
MPPRPVELRAEASRYLEAARLAEGADTKRQLASYALAFAQVAEAMERDVESSLPAKTARYEQLLERALGGSARQLAERLLARQQADTDARRRIKAWRLRAEELRTTADSFETSSAQEALRRAAENYDTMADQAEALLNGHQSSGKAGTGQ